jgi:repressor LexA
MTEALERGNESVEQGTSQEAVYTYVCGYLTQHGYPPSMRDIARACQMSVSTAWYNLDKLEAWGWLAREPHRARSLRVLKEPRG